MSDVIDELRASGLVLLVVDVPPPRHTNEDGSPMVFAHEDDLLFEVLEWCTMSRLRITRDPLEPLQAVLVTMTEGWRDSPVVMKAVVRTRRMKLPLFFLDPRDMAVRAD